MGYTRLGRCAAVCGLALALGGLGGPGGLLQAQDSGPATVSIEFLADRQCDVSAQGEGFRSHAVFKPQAAGDSRELRCAMPPIPKGRTIALTVTLAAGSERPGQSTPPLAWSLASDRWTGTAQLTEWPDAVAISPSSRLTTLAAPAGALVTIFAALALRRRRARRLAAATPPDR